MDVGHIVLGVTRRAGAGDCAPLLHLLAATDVERPEVGERHLVPVDGEDRHGQAVRGNLPRVRHLSARRRSDEGRPAERDVDSAVLAARVRVVTEDELAQDWAFRRPCPSPRSRRADQ